MVTLGQDLGFLPGLVAAAGPDFGAADVTTWLLEAVPTPHPG